MQLTAKNRCFEGWVEFYEHTSEACQVPMKFSVYRPDAVDAAGKVPVLYWLSGLTCTEQNFMIKSGVQRSLSRHGILLVAPDTSPRGAGVEGEDERWDLGTGAGFYVNATTPGWSKNYRMDDYVTRELPALIESNFPVDASRQSIFGHSMGGHGALTIALRHPDRFRSVSAFAPICAPSRCPWGVRAFETYLGGNQESWAPYDTVKLVESGKNKIPLLIDQGLSDEFLSEQLRPELLEEACKKHDHPLTLRRHEAYDHSFYFIASFIEDHVNYHAEHLFDRGR